MKSYRDPRHQKRREIVKLLFAEEFAHQPNFNKSVKDILDKREEIDKLISESAPLWPIDKLNKIDLAILRLAVYEMLTEDAPPKVIIDEAVELAKEFGSENSASFVNGVLGFIYQKSNKEK
ncbi:MAG: Transcription termination protein NusB [Candidatus Woesebacteria bacterium]|nr:MAG: Transcription termination protein NusB [Candidatus Woesebacteria bacterium]